MIGLEYILFTKGMKKSELARDLNIGRSSVSDWLSGRRKISKRCVGMLRQKFDVSERYLTSELDFDLKTGIDKRIKRSKTIIKG